MKRLLAGALCALCFSAAAMPQDNPMPSTPAAASATREAAPSKPDYSQEPFIFEQYATKIRFENDGTGERDYVARIRVQSDAGVQALGELTFGYNSANEQMNVQYVRVRKSDGTVVTADPSAVKEMTADVERDAPVYTDYKEKHITVPSLKPGDTLEYEIDTRLATPFAPGEFWYAQNFLHGAIILDESLEVNLPDGRAVKLAAPGNEYQTSRSAGRVIYTWKHSELTHPSDDDQKKQAQDSKPKPPDVQFTTFKSWGDVAQWYAKLEQGRSDPTPEIRVKVAELTQGKSTDLEKIQALYDYVAKNIRYVSLSFGLGRYQPHTAAEVFANQYGDCKDKATLLAAMMRAAGVPSDVALIPATSKLDETMPSPSQFDHVITAVPQGNGLVWIDSTTEVAPFRMLASTLRDKSALLVAPDGKGRIVRTPADPPFLATQTVNTEGTVNDLGKLTGTVHYEVRGDQELFLRIAFRHIAQAQWKQIGAAILQQDGLSGEVTSVESSDPTDTRDPFQITIHFSQSDFLPWTSKEPSVRLPLLSIGLPETTDDNSGPIELGSPLNVTVRLKLTLPANFKGRAPVGVAVSRDYAAFKSDYTLEGQTLTAERTMNFKMRELPAERTSDYLAFTHAVESDENQSLHLQNASAGTAQVPQSAKVEDVMDAAQAALHGESPQSAVPLFQRVIELDPKKYEKEIWNDLGIAYMYGGKSDDAIAAFRKQLDVNPYDESSNRYLAVALSREQKYDDAVDAYRKQIEINPLDPVAHMGLGQLLTQQHKDADAVPELEKAAAIQPENANVEVSLGRAYLHTGQKDKALEAFDRATQLSQTPMVWNNVAYEMAEQKLQLDKAQQYAESAVAAIAANLRNIDLSHLTLPQFQQGESLASFWDTLGWVYFQEGDFAKATRYIRAAWLVGQSGAMSDHLGQILQKQGHNDQAADAFAQGLAARHPDPDTRAHMMLLLGGNEKIDAMIEKARPELAQQRTFVAGKLVSEKAEAEFEVLLSPAGADGASAKVEDVKFLSGSDKLRPFADRLRAIDFGPMFPDASPAKLVQVGTLSCSASADCSFILTLPEDVHNLR
jgi:tetratricopeptide (TPR) repeat protein/transglutaminase-like putative cysteine protease